jgi:hypothetical protein
MMRGKWIGVLAVAFLMGAAHQRAHAQATTGLPPGFVCGLSYADEYKSPWPFNGVICLENVDATCGAFASAKVHTLQLTSSCGTVIGAAPGFLNYSDGDRGEPNAFGYYHQSWNTPNTTTSTKYQLPTGTACGFKESCNSTGQTCMGFDANVSCPAGWRQKWADDMNAPSGCRFVWCEYQDPNNLCKSQNCVSSVQPTGTVCGLTDSRKKFPSDLNGGQCMGLTPSPSNCASLGYTFQGFYDNGSQSGTGVGYCMKQ